MTIQLTPFDMLNALIAVLLLFFFLRRYAFPPLLKAIRDRQARIASDIETAERTRLEAEQLKQDLEQQLKEVRQRAELAMTRALRDAEEESRQIVEHARQEARRLMEEAETEIQAERERAVLAVKAQAANLAVAVAERVLGEGLTQEQSQKLFEQFVDSVGTGS
jgi:F-type H+-transporting ATPase subunit b